MRTAAAGYGRGSAGRPGGQRNRCRRCVSTREARLSDCGAKGRLAAECVMPSPTTRPLAHRPLGTLRRLAGACRDVPDDREVDVDVRWTLQQQESRSQSRIFVLAVAWNRASRPSSCSAGSFARPEGQCLPLAASPVPWKRWAGRQLSNLSAGRHGSAASCECRLGLGVSSVAAPAVAMPMSVT